MSQLFAKSWAIVCVALMYSAVVATAQEKVGPPKEQPVKVAQYLQDTSVTIRAAPYAGSGTMVQTKDGQIWIWTAGHVISHLRTTREVLDDKGGKRQKVEFEDAKIQRFNKDKEQGRIVSTYLGDAEVIRYSDSTYGHDLALLRLRDKEFKPAGSAKFYLDKGIPDVGEDLLHCGSLLGPVGSNSITGGLMSQHGRVFDNKIYDQTTATSFPGSSGGIVALRSDGRYVGMLVMGAGEGFGLIVPVRRMRAWAKSVGVEFALDPSKEVPKDEDLFSKPIEDSGGGVGANCCKERVAAGLKFMIFDNRDPLAKSMNTIKQWFARPGLLWKPEDK